MISMEEKNEQEEEYNEDELLKNNNSSVQNSSSSNWFIKMLSSQAEIITTVLISLVSPIFYILSFANIFEEEEESEKKVSVAVHVVATVSSKLLHGVALLLKKFGAGILGAAYVAIVLISLLMVSGILGFGFVRMWMEEPVILREPLYFDYADGNPKAVFSFGGGYDNDAGVPLGHTMYVSLFLLMPESDFNRDIGVFQVHFSLYMCVFSLHYMFTYPLNLVWSEHTPTLRIYQLFESTCVDPSTRYQLTIKSPLVSLGVMRMWDINFGNL